MTAKAMIGAMVRTIVRRFSPEKVILFGSRARGDASRDSDVDLLVVLPLRGSRLRKSVDIGVAVHDIRCSKDIAVLTPEELVWQRDIPGTLGWTAAREGRVLYARR